MISLRLASDSLEVGDSYGNTLVWEFCGMASVIDNKVGRKIALSNPNQSVGEFAKVKEELEQNRSLLKEMSENCKERQIQLSWEEKTKKMMTYYEQVKGHIETKL